VRIEFWRASGDVDSGDSSLSENLDAEFGDLSGHDLAAVGTGIDVAVPAGLIAEFADVDLKDGDAGCAKRLEPCFGKAGLERAAGRLVKDAKLFFAGREGILAAEQRQRHRELAWVV
jgi:hypothetical protein